MRWRDTFDRTGKFAARLPPIVVEVLVAVAITSLTAACRTFIQLFVSGIATFPLVFPAVAIATLLAGPRSGGLVIVLYHIFAAYGLPQPKYTPFVGKMSDDVSLLLILVAQLVLLWFVAVYRKYAVRTAELERANAAELDISRAALARQQSLEQQLRAQNMMVLEAQRHLNAIYQASTEGVALCTAIKAEDGTLVDYQVIEVNPAHKELTGATRERMLELPVSQIAPPVDPRWFTSADTALKTGRMQHFDVYSRATRRWLDIRVSPISSDLFQQTFIDVTDRHMLDEQRQSLLKEMSHRVLNNFQMIASFLQLQSAGAEPEVKHHLSIAKSRIQVIARLHALLAYSTTEAEVDVGSYLTELCGQLAETIDRPAAIKLICDCPSLRLNPDLVVPIGLITSELVMNAIKYAFPAPREGEIRVRFGTLEGGEMKLDITDNGIGLPEAAPGEMQSSQRGGLGMRLVQIFVRQLKGTLSTTSGDGLRHELIFRP